MERREKHKTNVLCVLMKESVLKNELYYVLALASREAGYLHFMFCFSKPQGLTFLSHN